MVEQNHNDLFDSEFFISFLFLLMMSKMELELKFHLFLWKFVFPRTQIGLHFSNEKENWPEIRISFRFLFYEKKKY